MVNTDNKIKNLLEKFSDDGCTCGKYDSVKQMPLVNACPIHEKDLYDKQVNQSNLMINTDKQPQTVYVQDLLGDYTISDKYDMLECNTSKVENVLLHTPAELQALKAEWQREAAEKALKHAIQLNGRNHPIIIESAQKYLNKNYPLPQPPKP